MAMTHYAEGRATGYCPIGSMVVELTLSLDFVAREYGQASYFSAGRTLGAEPLRTVQASGHATGTAQATGQSARRLSTRHLAVAECRATAIADAQAYVLADPMRAYGYATPSATWHQVAHGIGLLVIQPTAFAALAMVTHQASGYCTNSWEAGDPGGSEYSLEMDFVARMFGVYESQPYRKLIIGTALKLAGGTGRIEARATAVGEPALIRGPRQLDGSGRSTGVATVTNTVARVSTTGRVEARAQVQAQAIVRRAARGNTTCVATVRGSVQQVYQIPATGSATATATPRLKVFAYRPAKARGEMRATVRDAAVLHAFAGGIVRAEGRVRLRRLVLELDRQRAEATAQVRVLLAVLVRNAGGDSTPASRATGTARLEMRATGGAAGTATARAVAVTKETVKAAGRVGARALVSGYNRVNEPEPAPADRTLAVEAQDRSIGVERQDRQIVVGRASRALAA